MKFNWNVIWVGCMSLMLLAVSLPAISYYLYRDEEKPEPEPIAAQECPDVECPEALCPYCDWDKGPFMSPMFLLPTPEKLLVILPLYPVEKALVGAMSPWGVCGPEEDGYGQVCRIDTQKLTRLGRSVVRMTMRSRE